MGFGRKLQWAIVAGALLALAACERDAAPGAEPGAAEPVASDPREADESLTAREFLALPRFAEADLRHGERVYLQCRACHTLGEGEEDRPSGPNLWDVFGSRATERNDFPYSPALQASGIVWTPAALEAWLERPQSFVPGNRMPFAGIRDRADRTALIAYLLHETAPEAP